MAVHAAESERRGRGWPRPFGLLLIGAADFCGAVGGADLVFRQPAALWLFLAAVLLLWGIAAID